MYKLFKVIVALWVGFTGTRAMTLFPYPKTVRFLKNERKKANDPNLIPNENYRVPRKGFHGVLGKDITFFNQLNYKNGTFNKSLKYYDCKIYRYKNKINKTDTKRVILGFSNSMHCDPAQLMYIYRTRLMELPHIKKHIQNNPKWLSNNFYFIFPDGTPCTTESVKYIFKEVINANTFPPDSKLTTYSARIGMATMMLQRGLKEASVYDYGAWVRPKSKSAMMGYVRMTLEDKIKIPQFLCSAKVIYDDVIFSPADFNSDNFSF